MRARSVWLLSCPSFPRPADMPISPLAAAMMTGNMTGSAPNNMMLAADPAMLTAMPQMQIGQGLMQEGASTAPAYPAQALARVIQGAIGGSLYKGAVSDLGRAYSGVPHQLAEALAATQPNNPAIPFLNHPNPIVNMIGIQMAQKTVPIQAEGYSLGPNQVRGNAAGGVDRGSPAQGFAAERAEAAGAAPYKPAGTTVVNGVERPISEADLAASPAIPRQTGIGATPSGAVPPPEEKPVIGKTLQYQQQQESAKKIGENTGGAIGEGAAGAIKAGGQGAQQELNQLSTMQDALTFGGKGVNSGPWAQQVVSLKETLNGLGIDTSWVKNGLPESEVITKLNSQLASSATKALASRPSQFEFQTMLKNNPGLLNTKEGTMALISILKQSTLQDIGLGQM